MKSLFRLLVVFLLTAQVAIAQKTVSGVVSDPDGLPLPGATVLISGTTSGVTTDFDGNYSIADMDDVKIILEPPENICNHENVFIITSAPNNKHLRDSGSDCSVISQSF